MVLGKYLKPRDWESDQKLKRVPPDTYGSYPGYNVFTVFFILMDPILYVRLVKIPFKTYIFSLRYSIVVSKKDYVQDLKIKIYP